MDSFSNRIYDKHISLDLKLLVLSSVILPEPVFSFYLNGFSFLASLIAFSLLSK